MTLTDVFALPQRGVSLAQRLRTMSSLARQRRALGALDDRLLDDVGLTAEEARTEAARAPWDAPAHWQR